MRSRVFAAAITVPLLVMAAAPSALGETATASCSSDGHNNNDSATYAISGAYHVWSTAYYKFTGEGTGGKSNMIIRLRANGVDKWGWDSPDDRKNNIQYSKSMDSVKTLASATEYVLFRAIFDTLGSDPSCNAYTNNL